MRRLDKSKGALERRGRGKMKEDEERCRSTCIAMQLEINWIEGKENSLNKNIECLTRSRMLKKGTLRNQGKTDVRKRNKMLESAKGCFKNIQCLRIGRFQDGYKSSIAGF